MYLLFGRFLGNGMNMNVINLVADHDFFSVLRASLVIVKAAYSWSWGYYICFGLQSETYL